MNFSKQGIPILSLDEKIEALKQCLAEEQNEDAVGHLWDIMAHLFPYRKWRLKTVRKIFKKYGKTPTPIKY